MTQVYVSGYDPKDSALAPNDTAVERFSAGAAISAGMVVALSTADANGRTVIKATSAAFLAGAAVGVYTGVGGSGAAVTTTGLAGRDAVTSDMVQIVRQGFAAVQASPQTTGNMITSGTVRLAVHGTTAGLVQEGTVTSMPGGTLWASIATTAGTVYVVTARVNFR